MSRSRRKPKNSRRRPAIRYCSAGGSGNGSGANDPFLSAPPAQVNLLPVFDPGTQLDRYVVQEALGEGSTAHVYRVHDTQWEREVALKITVAGPCESNRGASLLQREMAFYGLVDDRRHVLKVYSLHTVRWGGIDLVMLSMEYANGGTLRDLLRRSKENGGIPYEQALEYFCQICAGVDALHAVGVIWGDIKPENIAIVNGLCKVFDFGHVSVAQGIAISDCPILRNDLDGRTVGTPEFISPEQFTRTTNNVDRESDIYSLGLVLRELVDPTGGPLFENPHQRMRQLHSRQAIPSLPDVDPAVSRVIDRCLETDPSKRYAAVQDLLDDLKEDDQHQSGMPNSEVDGHVDAMWHSACRYVTGLRLDQARCLCRQIIDVQPEHEHAAALLGDIEQRARRASQLYEAIDQGVGHRSLDQLCVLLEEAVGTYPNHPRGQAVQGMLQMRAQDYRIAMEQGKEAICRRDWPAAQASFEKARQLNPGTSVTEKALRFVAAVRQHIHHRRQLIDRAIGSRNWDRAMALARRIDEFVDGVIQTVSQPAGVESHDV